MKKKLLLVLSMVALLACIFALNISAETALKQQDSNEYGELSLFDESVTVGRTDTRYGYTPYIDAEGTTYARIVVGDGTTFYTFPTAYALSNTKIYGEGERSLYYLDMTSLNSAVAAVNGTNPGWTHKNIYRIELPYNMTFVNADSNQSFQDYTNIIEIFLQPNSSVKDQGKTMIFWKCINLETIHNLDTFVFRKGCLGGSFQGCAKLTNITIGVSAEVTDTGENTFNGCTNLKSVNFKEAFPNLTSIGKQCFYQCTNLVSTSSEEGVVSLPDGVTKIGYQNNASVFYECKAMKYLSLPTSLTHMGATAFYNCTALEFVDFNDNQNDIEFYNYGHFMNCTNLKAVSLSDGITVLNNRIFASCTSLQAVYLPANLEQMNTNGNGQGPFCYSNKMYFVQEVFEVRDENGNFYGDSFVMPEKPEIYYMPQNLSKAGGNVSSGTWFRDCVGLNKTIVMPEAFTDSTVVQMFRETASASNVKNVVYLGDMNTISWSERNHHINFIFANPNDRDISSVTFSYFYNNLNHNCYFYFCSTGYKYTMAKASVEEVATTLEENSYYHIECGTETGEASCESVGFVITVCFCGAEISREETPALGHDFEGGEAVIVFGATLYDNASQCVACVRGCGTNGDTTDLGVVIMEKGYSSCDIGGIKSFTRGYFINKELLKLYEEQKGISVAIGFGFTTGDLFGDATTATDLSQFPINMELKTPGAQFDAEHIDYVVRYKTDDYVDRLVVIVGYYSENGEVTFSNMIEKVSYNMVAAAGNIKENPDGSVDVSVDIGNLLG